MKKNCNYAFVSHEELLSAIQLDRQSFLASPGNTPNSSLKHLVK